MQHENPETDELECEVSEIKGIQMPANLVAEEFGEVNVRRGMSKSNTPSDECYVEFTIAMEPQGRFAEGWRTGLALDASASMKRSYGRKVEARVDPELLTSYIKQGRLRSYIEDGEPTRKIQRDAFAEIQERGYEIHRTENILQPLVQDFTAYLAGSLDGTGKTSLIYWGCGKGDEIQVLGEYDASACQQLAIAGPSTFELGKTTKLLPAIAYFVDRYRQAQHGIYIFLTDGRIDDLEQVKNYTKELALEIAVGKRNYLKLILIGTGTDVDRYQLQELDDFDTGLDIDLWDYKIASEMTNLTQIFAEVVNENQVIAENGFIYDDAGNCVKSYPKGLPAKVDFVMSGTSQWFELEVNNQRIRQSIVLESVAAIAPLAKKKLFDFEIKAAESDSALISDDRGVNSISTATPKSLWKIFAALLIGAAFIGTAIAFGILIKRSDNNKFQNQSIPSTVKESEIQAKSTPINKANTNSLISSSKANSNISSKVARDSVDNSKSIINSGKNSDKTIDKLSSNNPDNNANKPIGNSGMTLGDIPNNKSGINSGNISPSNLQKDPNNNFAKTIGDITENTSLSNFANNYLKSFPTSQSKTSDRPKTVRSDISPSILQIANPDLEVTIFFPSDESQLMPNEETKIDNFWAKVQGRRGIIQVSGHTDKMGDYAYNLDLSQARANEVVRLLRDRGLDNNYKVTFEALSWLQPLRKNTTATDNAFNRRVVIQFKEQR